MPDDVRNRWRRWLALLHEGVDRTVGLVREGQESAARGAMRVTDQIPGVAGPVPSRGLRSGAGGPGRGLMAERTQRSSMGRQ